MGKSVERWLDSIRGTSTEAKNNAAQETSVNRTVSSINEEYSSDGRSWWERGVVDPERTAEAVNCRGQLDDSIGMTRLVCELDVRDSICRFVPTVLIGWNSLSRHNRRWGRGNHMLLMAG
jgi:hypothetical protein